MIVKLIQPKMSQRPMDTKLKTRMAPSLGLLTVANVLNEYTVNIENENIKPIRFDEYVDVVGITVTVDVLPRAIEIAQIFRKKGIPVIAGGIHITANSKDCLEYFDALCIGPAEKTWKDIIEDIKLNKLKKIYHCNKSLKSNEIYSPAYNLINKSEYLYCNIISTSYGCPFRCDFCYNSCEAYQNFYVNKSIRQVISEIEQINKKHIMFIDDNFIGNPKWTLEFVRAIRNMKIKWNAAVSANIVDMPELLDEMKLSGCQGLFIGFETLNSDAISNVNKTQNNICKYERLINEIHSRQMMVNASFVFGLDGDDKSVFKTTLDWIIKNRIETVTSHILTPYPGTKLYDSLFSQSRIKSFNLSEYTTSQVIYKPQNMSQQELYEGYIWMYKQIYSFKNIIKRIPKNKKQILPYLLFNLLYRKFGKFTEIICEIISYEKLGTLAEKWSKYIP